MNAKKCPENYHLSNNFTFTERQFFRNSDDENLVFFIDS